MIIMAVESSCDETAVALVRDGREVLADCISSQVELHKIYGGVVPEIASRKHVEAIYGLADAALEQANLKREDIDAVAVTYAPGLIGAVLVGVNFAKTAAMALGVPLIPVHHIRGHIAANYLAFPDLEPPFLALVVSGGNTLIADVRDYTDLKIWAPPGMTLPVSVLTKLPGYWACLIPVVLRWTRPPSRETIPSIHSLCPRWRIRSWTCPSPA